MLPDIDSLPCAEAESAGPYWYSEVGMRQYAAHMSRHIVWPFLGMHETRVAVRNKIRHKPLEVPAHVRIRVLTQHESRARMTVEHMAEPDLDTALPDSRLNLARNIVSAAPGRLHENLALIQVVAPFACRCFR
jgi:hypothetical protein